MEGLISGRRVKHPKIGRESKEEAQSADGGRMVMRTGLKTESRDHTALKMARLEVSKICVARLRFFAIRRQCLDQLTFLNSYQTREEASPGESRVGSVA